MTEGLSTFTRKLEACRRRWNGRTLDYVVESGLILLNARQAAGAHGRWLDWLETGPGMDRSTAWRHVRISKYVMSNVALKHHLKNLSISKVCSLIRLKPRRALQLARDPRLQRLSDIQFRRFVQKAFPPRIVRRPRTSNLMRTLLAAVGRVAKAVHEWQRWYGGIPADRRARILLELRGILGVIRRSKAEGSAAS